MYHVLVDDILYSSTIEIMSSVATMPRAVMLVWCQKKDQQKQEQDGRERRTFSYSSTRKLHQHRYYTTDQQSEEKSTTVQHGVLLNKKVMI